MPRVLSRIPADLRDRPTMTQAQMQRALTLRSDRERMQTRLDNMPAVADALVRRIKANLEQEQALLATCPRAAADTPPPPPPPPDPTA